MRSNLLIKKQIVWISFDDKKSSTSSLSFEAPTNN